jgi:Xaa-Pro aminopeptidase
MIPSAELINRYQTLQALLTEQNLAGVFLLQNADLYYFTGTIQQGVLYIPASGSPLYLVRKDLNRARTESGLENIHPIRSLSDIPAIFAEFGLSLPSSVGMELDVLPVNHYQRFRKILKDSRIVDVSPLVRAVRAVKSDYEIERMRQAASQLDGLYQYAKEIIRVGRLDIEVGAELDYQARLLGHQGLARMRSFNGEAAFGHLMSGSDAAVVGYSDTPLGGPGGNPAVGHGGGRKKIARGEPIIFDYIGAFDGYLVDMTRTLCVGDLPDSLKKAYADMVAVHEKMTEIVRPGVTWGEVYEVCYELACELGYAGNFMGAAGSQVAFIGHGIGTEIDEYPFIAKGIMDKELKQNMTFAFEPKAVFPGVGAVGIENTFRVTADGVEGLTFSSEELVIL